jgi:exodeoxyribonuclease-5
LRELEDRLTNARIGAAEHLGVPMTDPVVDESPAIQELLREYNAQVQKHKQPLFDLNPDSELKEAKLLILDECSMVSEDIGTDLESFGCRILVLGDPFQLPPVGAGGYYTNGEPDVLLTDIQRQARDNPIIELSLQIREQRRTPRHGRYGDTRVVGWGDIRPEEALQAEQILVGRNATRLATNRRVRTLLGRQGWFPEPGDRTVCLRNDREAGLLNGSLWEVEQAAAHEEEDGMVAMRVRSLDLGDYAQSVTAHPHYFRGEGSTLPYWSRKEAQEFDYGYALTVHKAQGSQWGNVLLFDESRAFREDRWRWLYTGVTRAAAQLTMVAEG